MRFDARVFSDDTPDDHRDHECCGGDAELEALAAGLRSDSKYLAHCFPPQVEPVPVKRASMAAPLSVALSLAAVALVLLGWWAAHLGETPAGVTALPLADAGSARPIVEAVDGLPLEASSPAPVMSLINMVSGPELEAVIDLLEEGSQDGGLSI